MLSCTKGGGGIGPLRFFWILSYMIKCQHLMFLVVVRSSPKHIWVKISMVTRYDVIRSRWSSHFLRESTCFFNFFNNKSKSCGWNHAKCLSVIFHVKDKKSPFFTVLTRFLILGKIQEGNHCWWRSIQASSSAIIHKIYPILSRRSKAFHWR